MPRLQHVSIPRPPGEDSADQARSFYTDIIGLESKPVPSTIQHLDLVWFIIENDIELHVIAEEPRDTTTRRHFCLVMEDDLKILRKKIEEADYETWSPEEIRGRPRFFCRDPFDNIIEFTRIEANYIDFED